MSNGWTGGQYSLFRVVFGGYLFVHFVQLVPFGAEVFSNRGALPQASSSPLIFLFPNVLALWDGPVFVTAILVLAAGLSLLFGAGLYDRAASLTLWYLAACLFGRNPLIANPSLPFVGWMLLAHTCLPSAPYGSWAGRGRADPGASWRMPQPIFAAAWILMALGYTYSGATKLVSPSWLDGTALAHILENPLARPGPLRAALLALPVGLLHLATWAALGLELAFAPLALFRSLRPWAWGLMLAVHLGLTAIIAFADLSLGMVMLHGFTFDPAWVRPRRAPSPERLFYDGQCGLCHRAVRFVLAEDRMGDAFRFAPLGSEAFRAAVPASRRAGLPDSLVVLTADGALLTRSAAILRILRRLGGVWRVLAGLAGCVPSVARDAAYDGIARVRRRLFRPPEAACPIVPPYLEARFDP